MSVTWNEYSYDVPVLLAIVWFEAPFTLYWIPTIVAPLSPRDVFAYPTNEDSVVVDSVDGPVTVMVGFAETMLRVFVPVVDPDVAVTVMLPMVDGAVYSMIEPAPEAYVSEEPDGMLTFVTLNDPAVAVSVTPLVTEAVVMGFPKASEVLTSK